MLNRATCDQCGQPASVHETVIETQPIAVAHFCAQHAPGVVDRALGDVCRTIFGTPEKREQAIQAFAEQLGVEAEQIRQTVTDGLARLDRGEH